MTDNTTPHGQHTPGPWVFHSMSGVHGHISITTEAPEFKEEEWPYHPKIISVACMRGGPPREIAEANAAFIVRACNSHDALVEALKKTLPRIEEIRLVDMGAVMDAERKGYQDSITRARRELAETTELINSINSLLKKATGGRDE